MKPLNVILIKSFITIILYIASIIAYGFLIGGETGILFYMIIVLLVILSLLWILGKSLFKKENIMLVILIASVCCYFGSGIYMFFNNNFDSKPKCAYVSEISYIPNTHWFDESIFFLSPEGKEKEYYEFFDFDMLDLSEDFEEGRAIYVEEYEGAFGVEHYVIREENDG